MGVPFGYGAAGIQPGMQDAVDTVENQIGWGRSDQQKHQSMLISGAARDAGSSPTTQLRAGLILGIIAASGKAAQYDPDATDGTDIAVAILPQPYRVTDLDGNNQDLFVDVLVGGNVKGGSLVGLDLQARAQLARAFLFDDDLTGNPAEVIATRVKATDYTVVAADVGKRFTTRGAAGAVIFTLPAPAIGLKGAWFEFYNEADQNLTLGCASANKLVYFNNLTATSVALSTAGNKIGSGFRASCNDDGSKWLIEKIGQGTVTVA